MICFWILKQKKGKKSSRLITATGIVPVALLMNFTSRSMNKINSKQKGARFERTLAHKLNEYGFTTRRTAQYCGNTGDASDVVGLPYIHIEAKHQERMQLYEWMHQAERDCKGLAFPTVFHKKNNEEILVTMRLDDWIELYKSYAVGMDDAR